MRLKDKEESRLDALFVGSLFVTAFLIVSLPLLAVLGGIVGALHGAWVAVRWVFVVEIKNLWFDD